MLQVIPDVPAALIRKLDELSQRHADLEKQMSDPAVLSNSQKLIAISKEKGQLDPIIEKYGEYRKASEQVEELRQLSENKADADMAELAAAELPEAQARASQALEVLKDQFLAAEDNA